MIMSEQGSTVQYYGETERATHKRVKNVCNLCTVHGVVRHSPTAPSTLYSYARYIPKTMKKEDACGSVL